MYICDRVTSLEIIPKWTHYTHADCRNAILHQIHIEHCHPSTSSDQGVWVLQQVLQLEIRQDHLTGNASTWTCLSWQIPKFSTSWWEWHTYTVVCLASHQHKRTRLGVETSTTVGWKTYHLNEWRGQRPSPNMPSKISFCALSVICNSFSLEKISSRKCRKHLRCTADGKLSSIAVNKANSLSNSSDPFELRTEWVKHTCKVAVATTHLWWMRIGPRYTGLQSECFLTNYFNLKAMAVT